MDTDYFGIELSESVHLALPLDNLGTVLRLTPEKICSIPGVPPFLLGVINHQGSLLWVLDTYRFLNLESDANCSQKCLTAIILKSSLKGTRKKVALLVNKLQGVLTLKKTTETVSSNHFFSSHQNLFKEVMITNNIPIGIMEADLIFEVLQKPLSC